VEKSFNNINAVPIFLVSLIWQIKALRNHPAALIKGRKDRQRSSLVQLHFCFYKQFVDFRKCVLIVWEVTNRKIQANDVIILEVNKYGILLKWFRKADARQDSSYYAPIGDLNLDCVVIWENFLRNKHQLFQLALSTEIILTFRDRKEFVENHCIA